MSSRFVASGGAEIDEPVENDDWARARKLVEEKKKPQVEAAGTQDGGKSLFEHLQAQKAAKQEAFEEASRLRNQFRPLDDSEVEFLESVKRKEIEDALEARRATAEQLDAFRREQAALENASKGDGLVQPAQSDDAQVIWTATKKRRRPQTEEVSGANRPKKLSTEVSKESIIADQNNIVEDAQKTVHSTNATCPAPEAKPSPASKAASPIDSKSKPAPAPLLVSYDSDSDT